MDQKAQGTVQVLAGPRQQAGPRLPRLEKESEAMIDGWMENDDWPDWRDTGRVVTMESSDGKGQVTGMLVADDVWFDGTDEVPVFMLLAPDGTKLSFAANDRWRFDTMRISERQELRLAAVANFRMNSANLLHLLDLIDGEYKNDPDAARGALWSMIGD